MTITSFEQLREHAGLKPLKEKVEKPILCRKCGKEMTKVASNMWHCKNEDEKLKDKNGNPKICGNIYIRKGYR